MIIIINIITIYIYIFFFTCIYSQKKILRKY